MQMMDNADDGPTPSQEQIDAWRREDLCLKSGEASPDLHPRLHNLSVGFTMKAVVRALRPDPLAYAVIDMRSVHLEGSDTHIRQQLAIHKWNQIAQELISSAFTIKTHANRATMKIGARDRA